jgi:hypothetical protein
MKIKLNPFNWFKKAKQIEQEKVIDKSIFTWVAIDFNNPHSGFSNFAHAKECPFTSAIKLYGMNVHEAKRELTGKVLNWDLMDKSANSFEFDAETILGVLR